MPASMSRSNRITRCRFCGGGLTIPFCDLGAMPLANGFVSPEQAGRPDPVLPLNVVVCELCHLAQLDHTADAKGIFTDYAYFSSYSTSWLGHARAFCAEAAARFGLGRDSFVVEVASNDGYLLRSFVAAGIPCLGVEPAANVAAAAIAAGVATRIAFFGRDEAARIVGERGHADLVIANNVLAHVPDVNDFVAGLALLAGPAGVVSIEAPHLLRLIEGMQFDTMYHEHFFYWSLTAMTRVLAAHGLRVMRVEALATHGGSLRVTASAMPHGPSGERDGVAAAERAAGLLGAAGYAGFQPRVAGVLDGLRRHLRGRRRRVAAYGAAAKGNTLLNAAGITRDDVAMVADRNPAKQGRLLPGSRIPVVTQEDLAAYGPDEVLILPWNLADEITSALRGVSGHRTIAIPRVQDLANAA